MQKKIVLTAILLSALLVSSLSGAMRHSVAQTSTQVGGIIDSDATWTLANSPYSLTGDVQVSNGTTLTIEAGVTVNFDSYFMNVSGTLIAVGNQTSKIAITGSGKGYSGEWEGRIAFQNTSSNSIIDYAQITSTPDTIIGIYSSTQTSVTNSIIGGTDGNAVYMNGSSPSLTGNVISGNGGSGIVIERGSPMITGNIISNNAHSGIDASYHASPTISRNNIAENDVGISLFVAWVGDTATISENTISNNSRGIYFAFFNSYPFPYTVTGNLITNCTDGILLEVEGNFRGGVTIVSNTVADNTNGVVVNGGVPAEEITVNQNNIYGNTQYNLKTAAKSGTLDATNNWWGTNDTQAINQTIYQEVETPYGGLSVNFVPFLTKPNLLAPKYDSSTPTPSPSPSSTPTPSPSPSPSPSPTPTPSLSPSPSPNPSPSPSPPPSSSPTQQHSPEIPTAPPHEKPPDLTVPYIIVSITISAIVIAVAVALVKFRKHKKTESSLRKQRFSKVSLRLELCC